MPEPRSIGPLKPQSAASCALTLPTSTVRCLKMRFSVSSVSMSSMILGNVSVNAMMSSASLAGMSSATPPGRK
jgi:hypothetical protein